MFQENSQIIKKDGKGVFVDIRETFEIDRVVLQFRRYDNTAEKGAKIKASIDYYMELEDFHYLCYVLYSGGINKLLQGKGYAHFSGSKDKSGRLMSRILRIEGGTDDKYFLKAQTGPGKPTSTGAVLPAFGDKPETEIVIKLTSEELKTIGLAGERAIRIRDMWLALGVLEERCQALKFKKDEDQIPSEKKPAYKEVQNYRDPQKQAAASKPKAVPYSTDSSAPELF